MESYANALLYATPFFLVLVLIELIYGHFVKRQQHRFMDTISSLSSGLTNVVKDSLGLVVVLIGYPFLVDHLSLVDLGNGWAVWAVAFVAIDFAGYWNHRLSHHVNIFWNQHMIHHSSEEFNLACALRQPISNLIGYFGLLLLPAALLGVPAQVIAILAPIHLFAQFWYHTRHIGKMGWLEYVIVTPSQHRVHHAINPQYIDKNLGQIFCLWDRMFGTFQEELEQVPPQYGVLKAVHTWNPLIINFQHFWRMCQDAWRTRNFWDKLRIWFMPTGWRPPDVRQRYPIEIIEDVYGYEKYSPPAPVALKAYVLFQLVFSTGMMLFMFHNYSQIGFQGLLLLGAFIFLGIFGYTSLMDGKGFAPWIEMSRSLAGLAFLYWSGDWFGIQAYSNMGSLGVALYFLVGLFGGIYFSYGQRGTARDLVA